MKNLSLVNLVNVTFLGTSATGFLCLSLLDASIKSLLLLVLSTITCHILVRASAATRHWIWATTMIGLLLMPAFALFLPEWRVLPSWLSLESRIEQQLTVNKSIAIHRPTSDGPVLSQQSSGPEYALDDARYSPSTDQLPAYIPTASIPNPIRLSANLLLSVWGLGCLLCLIPVVISLLRLRQTERVFKDDNPLHQRLLRSITKIAGELGIVVPRVIVGPTGVMPMVWTFGESRLFLPADTEQWTTTRLNAVLLHEMIHLKRRDPTWFLIGLLARAVNWFNPFAWYGVHRLRIECERACDDQVLRMGVDAADYATHLLALSTSVSDLSGRGSIALAMATKPNVENRIVSILNEKANRCGVTLRRAVGVLVVVSIGVAVLASLAATASDKNSTDEKDEEIQLKYPYCVVVVDDVRPRSLDEAVAAFNKEAKESPTGVLQPPITEQETLAAIAKFIELEHVAEPTKATLREIAKTKTLPAKAFFRRFTRFDDEQQMQGVWWVRLFVEEKDPPVYSVPVRTTPIFTRPYTQMERQQNAEKGLTLINRFVSYFEEQPNIRLR
ncbi:MAG: M56 family metallopeptidase, partial [Pirellula sp.]